MRSSPEWRALQDALDALVRATSGRLAAIVDERDVLWCWSSSAREGDDPRAWASQFHVHEIAGLTPPLRRGGRLRIARADPFWRTARSYVAESFENLYVLVVWFDEPAGGLDLHAARIHAELPRIAALTLALPPDGPGADEGAGKLGA